MKKINLLSKAEMKKVMGGNEIPPGSCNESCGSGSNSASCTSETGSCSRSGPDTALPWIKCDGIKYDCPV